MTQLVNWVFFHMTDSLFDKRSILPMKLAKFLKDSRVNAGLTQGKVAEVLEYTTAQFISNWERGVSHPPIDILKKLARLYNVSDEELYSIIEEVTIEETKKDLRRKFMNSGKLSRVK